MLDQDFWTTVGLVVILLIGVAFPIVLRQGLTAYSAILILGPLVMAALAWYERQSAES